MIKEIGNSKEVFISIKRESLDNYFAELTLVINGEIVINKVTGYLGYLCVSFEGFEGRVFPDNYFWTIDNTALIRMWDKYYNARTLSELNDSEVMFFDTKFVESSLHFTSDFFDEWALVAYSDKINLHLKLWKINNADIVHDFIVSKNAFNEVINGTIEWLRSEVLT